MRIRTGIVVSALAILLVTAACTPAQPKLEAHWPRADVERTTSRPAEAVVWPLTGKPAVDASAATSPAVALALSGGAAPMPGLDGADVVYEAALDGDALLAIYHSALPASAGPLRHARQADAALASAYGATLAQRDGSQALADVAELASAPSSATTSPPSAGFAASPPPAATGTVVQALEVPLATGRMVEWRYEPSAGAWRRYVDGKPATAQGSTPIRATNVVVMWVTGETWPGRTVSGTGRASVFLDGRKFVGSWSASGTPPAFTDADGAATALMPGNTWVEVVGNATNIVVR